MDKIEIKDIARKIKKQYPEYRLKDINIILKAEQQVINNELHNNTKVGWGSLYTFIPEIKPAHKQNTWSGKKLIPAHIRIKTIPRKLIKELHKKSL